MNSNGKRHLHYPEQIMKPHSKALAEADPPGTSAADDFDDELAELVKRDAYVQGLLMKSGQGKDQQDGTLKYPEYTFVGTDPKNNNPFTPSFFVSQFCYQTPSYRLRRSVFKIPGEDKKRHYVYLSKTRGKNLHELIRLDLADLLPLEQAFAAIREEIDAYPPS